MTPVIWLAVGAVLVAIEMLMPGFIVFWFGLAAFITAFVVFLGIIETLEYQYLFFFISSAVFLMLWFGVLKKHFKKENNDDERDPTLANLRGRCTIAIDGAGKPGEVELYEPYHGITKWKAESSELINVGDEIFVLEASGIKLIIKKI